MGKLTNIKPLLSSVAPRLRPPPKTVDQFYTSPEWRALLAEIIRERGRRCEDCGKTNTRIYGDHIHEIKDGGAPLDKRNVRLRCGLCHGTKTAQARARRARGQT